MFNNPFNIIIITISFFLLFGVIVFLTLLGTKMLSSNRKIKEYEIEYEIRTKTKKPDLNKTDNKNTITTKTTTTKEDNKEKSVSQLKEKQIKDKKEDYCLETPPLHEFNGLMEQKYDNTF